MDALIWSRERWASRSFHRPYGRWARARAMLGRSSCSARSQVAAGADRAVQCSSRRVHNNEKRPNAKLNSRENARNAFWEADNNIDQVHQNSDLM